MALNISIRCVRERWYRCHFPLAKKKRKKKDREYFQARCLLILIAQPTLTSTLMQSFPPPPSIITPDLAYSVPVYGPRCFERRTPNAERKEHDLFPFRPKPRAKYRQIKAPPFQIRRYAYSNICNVIRRKRKKFCMIYAPTYVHVDRQTCILIFPSIGKKNQCE